MKKNRESLKEHGFTIVQKYILHNYDIILPNKILTISLFDKSDCNHT